MKLERLTLFEKHLGDVYDYLVIDDRIQGEFQPLSWAGKVQIDINNDPSCMRKTENWRDSLEPGYWDHGWRREPLTEDMAESMESKYPGLLDMFSLNDLSE